MTDLNKKVQRVSRGTVREVGQERQIVIGLEPPDILTFRAKGCRKKYSLTANVCYTMAVRAHVAAEKRAKKAKKKKRK